MPRPPRPTDPNVLLAYSIRIRTGLGTLYVHIAENSEGHPCLVLINLGKSGAELAAWCDAVARLVTRLVNQPDGIYRAIEELSGLSSNRAQLIQGRMVLSGPDAVAKALLTYRERKFFENKPKNRPGGASRS